MPAPDGNTNNPNIVAAGKPTQFGQPGGADPRDAREKQINPTSIRSSLHRLMAYPIDTTRDLKEQLAIP